MSARLQIALSDDVKIIQDTETALKIESPVSRLLLTNVRPSLLAVLDLFKNGGATQQQIQETLLQHDGGAGIFKFQHHYSQLIAKGMIYHLIYDSDQLLARLMPLSGEYRFESVELDTEQNYILSRFAVIRREDNHMILETPRSNAMVVFYNTQAALLPLTLTSPCSVVGLQAVFPQLDGDAIRLLMRLLLQVNALSKVNTNGQSEEDADTNLISWEFHDLLFHSRIWLGRNHKAYGGTYRFIGKLRPQPTIKPIDLDKHETVIDLYKPDIEMLSAQERSFTSVLEGRTSIRRHNADQPLTVEQLGEFLYRSARVRELFDIEVQTENGNQPVTLSRRPYPSGGASYELEIYATVHQCAGIEPGFYYYHPLRHQLIRLSEMNKQVELLLVQARLTWSDDLQANLPQVLLTFAARFQRVSWKYQSLAYAIILKNVGVLLQTMYLTAEAMGLAGCALGGGSSDTFTHILGENYYAETSVGEFMLGSRAESQ